MNKPVLLLGGGLDSTALFLQLIKEGIDFSCVHVDYGQVAHSSEYHHCAILCHRYGVTLHNKKDIIINGLTDESLLLGDDTDNIEVKARNFTLILHALAISKTIYLGLDLPEGGKTPLFDTTSTFLQDTPKALKALCGIDGVSLRAPCIFMYKEDVYREAYDFDKGFFNLSISCFTPASNYSECGVCSKCATKIKYRKMIELSNKEEII